MPKPLHWLPPLLAAAALAALGANDPLSLARASLANGLYANAEQHLVTYLAVNQRSPELCVAPLILLCRAVDAQKRPADLLRLLQENADIVAQSPDAFAIWEVRSLLALQRTKEALARCDEALANLAQGNGDALDDTPFLKALRATALARLPDRQDEASAAFRSADEALADLPTLRADLLLQQAQFELSRGSTNEAVQVLDRLYALPMASTNSAAALALASGRLLLARIRIHDGATPAAIPLLQSLDDKAVPPPVQAEALYELAALAANGMLAATNELPALDVARSYGERIFSLPLPDAQYHRLGIRYGQLLLPLKNGVQPAAAALKRAIHLDPSAEDSAHAQLALADAWLREGSNSTAIAEYRNFLEAYTASPALTAAALRGQATASLREGNYEASATLFQKAAQNSPEDPAPDLLSAAHALFDSQRYAAASTIFLRAADALAVSNSATAASALPAARARFQAADALERSGDAATAESLYQAIAETPTPVAESALFRLALLAERKGDIPTARKRYSRLIGTSTNASLRAQALLGRGRGHYHNFSFQNAIADFSEAALVPEFADEASYLNILAHYGYNLNSEALGIATNVLAQATSRRLPEITLWVAQYRFNNREYALAQASFTDYSSKWPQSPSAPVSLLWAAYSAYMHEEYQQCIDLLSQLATTYPDNAHGAESRLLQARALVALARFEDAAAVLDDLLTRFPGSHYIPSALLLRGDALFSTPGASADTARQSYLAAAAHVGASAAQKLECAYKVARCMLRLGEKDEDVLRQYQDHVIAPCMELLDKGDGLDARSGEWYAKSIFEVSEIEVKRGHLDSAITLLERLASSRLPDAERARDRIRQLREESWRTPAPASP